MPRAPAAAMQLEAENARSMGRMRDALLENAQLMGIVEDGRLEALAKGGSKWAIQLLAFVHLADVSEQYPFSRKSAEHYLIESFRHIRDDEGGREARTDAWWLRVIGTLLREGFVPPWCDS